jgi:hypothetical protein
MTTQIFIKRGGSREVQHRQVDVFNLKALKKELDQEFGPGHLFLEDGSEPIGNNQLVEGGSLFVHHNSCKRIQVTVRYAGKSFNETFGPGVTLKVIKRRAEKALEIDETDAAELSLQVEGTIDRPDEATHIGSLSSPGTCSVSLDLVPSDRING